MEDSMELIEIRKPYPGERLTTISVGDAFFDY